ncbi:MAG: trimeric intracellular cation channel family protein [Gemmatimonadales bacterium]
MRYVLDLLGVAVFAVSGVLAAGRKGLDVLGVAVIAVVTAVGGGTLRDLLLNRHPIFWIANPTYLYVIVAATVVTLAYVRFWVASRGALLLADALGLAFFTVTGAQLTQQSGHSPGIALLMGTVTGVAGGIVRDVLTAQIPLVLRPGLLYATAAVVGAAVYLGLTEAGISADVASLAGMGVIVALRLAAILRGWRLPVVKVPDDETEPPPIARG